MYRFLLSLVSCTAILGLGVCAQAGLHHHGRSDVFCPKCNTCCTLKVERVKEDKACYEVECVEICIPRVVFPWQKWKADRQSHGGCDSCDGGCEACSSVNNGARVKTVKKLKKRSYKCPVCKYTWTPAGNSGCVGGDCCDDARVGATRTCDDLPPASRMGVEQPVKITQRPLPARDFIPARPAKPLNPPSPPAVAVARRSLSGR